MYRVALELSSFARALREIGEFFLSLVVRSEKGGLLLTYSINKPHTEKLTLSKDIQLETEKA